MGNLHARRRDFGAMDAVVASKRPAFEEPFSDIAVKVETWPEETADGEVFDEIFQNWAAPRGEEVPFAVFNTEDPIHEDPDSWSMALAASMAAGAGMEWLAHRRRRACKQTTKTHAFAH